MTIFGRLLLGTALGAVGLGLIWGAKAWGQDTPATTSTNPPAVFVLIENGGTVQARDEMSENINFLLGELTQLRRRRATRDTQVHIVLSADPTQVAWSGTPEQLFLQGHEVLDVIAFRDTCSDLVLAWDQIEITARITMPSAIELIQVGPMIHAGFPCDGDDTVIKLPQPVPTDLALADMANEARRLLFIGVHADQDEVYLDHLRDTGALARARSGEVVFDLLDMARARAVRGAFLEDK
ncbi:MAG: hypothetical protein AAGF94_16670 [Pseudomonadota bacterium]